MIIFDWLQLQNDRMFESKIMDFWALFGWWRGHLLLAVKEVFLVWTG